MNSYTTAGYILLAILVGVPVLANVLVWYLHRINSRHQGD